MRTLIEPTERGAVPWWFGKVWGSEPRFMGHIRAQLAEGCTGRVLDLGARGGANLAFYPRSTTVTAVDFDQRFTALARARLSADENATVAVVDRVDGQLPFDDDSFDNVLSVEALCRCRNLGTELQEVRRVLRPGGTLHFFEHQGSANKILARIQRGLTPAWRLMALGCHLDRSIIDAMQDTGFSVESAAELAPYPQLPPFLLFNLYVKGSATVR